LSEAALRTSSRPHGGGAADLAHIGVGIRDDEGLGLPWTHVSRDRLLLGRMDERPRSGQLPSARCEFRVPTVSAQALL